MQMQKSMVTSSLMLFFWLVMAMPGRRYLWLVVAVFLLGIEAVDAQVTFTITNNVNSIVSVDWSSDYEDPQGTQTLQYGGSYTVTFENTKNRIDITSDSFSTSLKSTYGVYNPSSDTPGSFAITIDANGVNQNGQLIGP
eukprot:Gb_38443 [translate_table: standard]